MNEKNEDYFTCPKQNDTLTALRAKTYPSISDMKKDIQKLNKDFGCQDDSEDVVGMVCNMKSVNCYLKCVYKDCKYEHWFTYKQGGKVPLDIKYSRSINKNHSIQAHKSGVKREQCFL